MATFHAGCRNSFCEGMQTEMAANITAQFSQITRTAKHKGVHGAPHCHLRADRRLLEQY
eukprot:SAG31_NODE_41_length_31342_cov_8.029286_23_plen_59_part_00